MTDRREYPAKVIGVDQRTDVAVIKIEGKNLPVVRIGDPSKLRPGEWVLAIGSPFTFENSVTAGIVSATGRSMPGENDLVPFIQTDVAVNPGNSGGPLFNLNGEVVGINSQIYSRSGGYMGISFAIPIDVANNVQAAAGEHRQGHARPHRRADPGSERAVRRRLRPRSPARRAGRPGHRRRPGREGRHQDRRRHPERRWQVGGTLHAAARGDLGDQARRQRQGRSVARRREQDVNVKVDEFQEETQKVANSRCRRRAAPSPTSSVCPCGRWAPTSARAPRPRATCWSKTWTGLPPQAGVRPGDVILGVNGKTVKSIAELRNATANGLQDRGHPAGARWQPAVPADQDQLDAAIC